MDYTHSHPSIIASLFGTMHCPLSPRESVQTSQVHPNPVIWYALSHISLIISSSKQPPYLPIMSFPWPFRDILPCNFHRFRFDDLSIHYHIALHDHIVDIVVVAQPPFIIFHTCYARSLHILVYYQKHSYSHILSLVSSCNFYFFWVISK